MQPPIGITDPGSGRRLVANARVLQGVDECIIFILGFISAHDKGAPGSRLVPRWLALVATLGNALRYEVQSLGKVVGRNVSWRCGKDVAESCCHGEGDDG